MKEEVMEKEQEKNTATETPETHPDQEEGQVVEHKISKLSPDELKKEYKKLLKIHDKMEKQLHKTEKQLEEKTREVADNFDKYRRSLAEAENIRKRSQQERQDFAKYANFKIIEDLLTILDDFQRAIDHAKTGNIDFASYQEGIEIIEKQFLDLLFKKYGVTKYGDQGEDFDPNIHQAMMMEEGKFATEMITEIFRKGYMLHDRVIRPAQVKVGKPLDDDSTTEENSEEKNNHNN
ncbi:MAG: nucleotide exchange factor GrpE [Spirochaetes bacterium]|nr:nucleotide exchange factor GrpE [Spirochaetota bacterium]